MSEGQRFCNHPDVMQVGGRVCKWNKKHLVYGFSNTVPGVAKDQLVAAMKTVWERWAAVCDIRASHIKTPQDAVDIVVGSKRFDGAGGVLAEAGLPCSTRDPQPMLTLMLDIAEPWSLLDVPASRGQVSLTAVLQHETGHNLGSVHGPAGALMAPFIQHGIYLPQAWDANQMVERYGPPPSRPVEPPTTTPEDMIKLEMILPRDSVRIVE